MKKNIVTYIVMFVGAVVACLGFASSAMTNLPAVSDRVLALGVVILSVGLIAGIVYALRSVAARLARLTSPRRAKSWEHVLLSATVALLCAGALLGGLQIAKRIYFWLWPFGIDGWVRG
jgi:uncharacterized membrane protein YoaK (UPF0700 family)